MKTLIVYELIPEYTKFFLVDGDKSYLNGCIIGANEDKFSKKVVKEVNEPNWGNPVKTPVHIQADTVVVHCGLLL